MAREGAAWGFFIFSRADGNSMRLRGIDVVWSLAVPSEFENAAGWTGGSRFRLCARGGVLKIFRCRF